MFQFNFRMLRTHNAQRALGKLKNRLPVCRAFIYHQNVKAYVRKLLFGLYLKNISWGKKNSVQKYENLCSWQAIQMRRRFCSNITCNYFFNSLSLSLFFSRPSFFIRIHHPLRTFGLITFVLRMLDNN